MVQIPFLCCSHVFPFTKLWFARSFAHKGDRRHGRNKDHTLNLRLYSSIC
jgi:hypothetical protein